MSECMEDHYQQQGHFSIEEDTSSIDSLILIYLDSETPILTSGEGESSRRCLGLLGCVKQMADICLNKVNLLQRIQLPNLPSQQERNELCNASCHKLLFHTATRMIELCEKEMAKRATKNSGTPTPKSNGSATTTSSSSYQSETYRPPNTGLCDPIVDRLSLMVKECLERARDGTVNCESAISTLKYVMIRSGMIWDSSVDQIVSLVQLGDRFLKQSAFYEASMAYQEAMELLLFIDIPSMSLDGEHDEICRLSILGNAHALFGLNRFLESGELLALGLHYFPTFPSLPFDPNIFYNNDSHNLMNTIANLELEIERVMQEEVPDQSPMLKQDHLHILKFTLAFYLHFLDDQQERAIEICNKILLEDDSLTYEINLLLNPLVPRIRRDSIDSQNSILALQNQINMSDTSLRQLERWTLRMLDSNKGIEIKNRKYRFKSYDKCFVASEAITWLCDNGNISRSEATTFLQWMMDRAIFRNVIDGSTKVSDNNAFFELHTLLLEHCFTPILKQGNLFISGHVKWNRIFVILYESAIAFFEERGGKIRFFSRLDKNNVVIGLPQAAFARMFNEENMTAHSDEQDDKQGLKKHSASFSSLLMGGSNNHEDHIFHLTLGLQEPIILKTENQYGSIKNERDAWVQCFKNLPYVKIAKM